MSKLRQFAHNNGLSLAILGLFLLFLVCESVIGYLRTTAIGKTMACLP